MAFQVTILSIVIALRMSDLAQNCLLLVCYFTCPKSWISVAGCKVWPVWWMGKTFSEKLLQELPGGTGCVEVDMVKNSLWAGNGIFLLLVHFFMEVMKFSSVSGCSDATMFNCQLWCDCGTLYGLGISGYRMYQNIG